MGKFDSLIVSETLTVRFLMTNKVGECGDTVG